MEHTKIIESLGGTCSVASMCEISAQAVSQWRINGIPKPWLMYFREIRPDLFPSSLRSIGAQPAKTAERTSDDCGRRVVSDRRDTATKAS